MLPKPVEKDERKGLFDDNTTFWYVLIAFDYFFIKKSCFKSAKDVNLMLSNVESLSIALQKFSLPHCHHKKAIFNIFYKNKNRMASIKCELHILKPDGLHCSLDIFFLFLTDGVSRK